MKLITITMLSLITLYSYAGTEPRSIDVYGASEVVANPDGIDWGLEVTTYGDSTADAKEENDQAVLLVKELLRQSERIEKIDIKGSRLNRTYDAEAKKLKAFNAETYIGFQSYVVDKQQDLATGLSQIPGVSIRSCEWITTNRSQLVRDARSLALKAAREKATEMAAVLNMQVGLPILIEERSSRWEPTGLNISMENEGVTQSDTGGKVRIGANVRVVFELNKE